MFGLLLFGIEPPREILAVHIVKGKKLMQALMTLQLFFQI